MAKRSGSAGLAPKQARSRASLQRLISSTVHALDKYGLEGATVPRIAAGAGLTPGAVYRRFPSKEALLRGVFLEALRASDAAAESMLTPALAARPLRDIMKLIVTAGVESLRAHAGLVRAMRDFYQASSPAYRRQADAIQVRTFRRIEKFLLSKRSEMGHPNPEAAVPMAMAVVSGALREIATLRSLSTAWADVLTQSDERLVAELTRVYTAYLVVAP